MNRCNRELIHQAIQLIFRAFPWSESPQGHAYWEKVVHNLRGIAGITREEIERENEEFKRKLMGEIIEEQLRALMQEKKKEEQAEEGTEEPAQETAQVTDSAEESPKDEAPAV